jgi:hypothetical protein
MANLRRSGMNRRRSWQLPSLLSSWLRRVLTAGVECDLKSQSIERRCDERETRRMKAKRYKARRNKAKLSFLSYRRATCFHLLWAAANTIVPSHPLFTITYLLPRQFSCTPYNKCSGFEPLSCRATKASCSTLTTPKNKPFAQHQIANMV